VVMLHEIYGAEQNMGQAEAGYSPAQCGVGASQRQPGGGYRSTEDRWY